MSEAINDYKIAERRINFPPEEIATDTYAFVKKLLIMWKLRSSLK